MQQKEALFTTEQIQPSRNIRFLHIVKNGQSIDCSLQEIFDSSMFNELYAITYVSSAKFFSRVVKNFVKVQFVLGIPDTGVLNQFATNVEKFINVEERIRFWNELDEEIKGKFQDEQITLRFTTFGSPPLSIHSKIYLLANHDNDTYRVIIGSANLTENAFQSKRQFEEIMIFDDKPLYDVYFARFKEIYAKTVDYIPDECTRKGKKQLIYTDAETLKKVLFEEVEKRKPTIYITEADMKEIESLPIQTTYHKEQADVTLSVIRSITKPSSRDGGGFSIADDLRKRAVAIKTTISRINKQSEDVDARLMLQYNQQERQLFMGSKENETMYPFSAPANESQIAQSLMLINKFVETYGKFTINPDLRNQSKILEIILYSFISPFLWMIREDYVQQEGRESVRAIFRPFLIIAGRAESGKTTALEFISILLGNHGKRFFPYKDVDKKGILLDYFHSSNVYPLLIDEVPVNFFKSIDQTKGEALIKHVSNDLNVSHPVLIATTNQTKFSVNNQILRRVYYLEINNKFDNHKAGEAGQELNEILSRIDNILFKDFTYRVCNYIRQREKFYEVQDPLYIARHIFKQYYQDAYLDLPKWFPETPFIDYEERGRKLWQNTFKAYPQAFKEHTDDTIFVETSEFCQNSPERQTYIDYLNPACIHEDNVILVLSKKDFYKFIRFDGNISNKLSNVPKKQQIQKLRQWVSNFFRRGDQKE